MKTIGDELRQIAEGLVQCFDDRKNLHKVMESIMDDIKEDVFKYTEKELESYRKNSYSGGYMYHDWCKDVVSYHFYRLLA